jgi:amino acid transporter
MTQLAQEQAQHSTATRALPSERYSERALPPMLGAVDLTAMYLAVIFFIGNAGPTAAFGGVVSLTYLAIGAITYYLPCVLASAQLGVLYPYEGSLYNWTCRTLGRRWGYFAAFGYWLPNVLAIVGAADGLVTYLQGMNSHWLIQPWQQGVVILVVILFTALLGSYRLRTTQNVVNGSIALTLFALALVVVSCLVFLAQNHGPATPLGNPGDWMPNGANFPLFGLIALLYLGTSVPLNMAGELRTHEGRAQRKIITRSLFWGTIFVLGGYFLTTFALLVVRGPAMANDPIAPYEVVMLIQVVLGKFMAGVATVCILSFYVISPLVYNYATARLLFAGSVDQALPKMFGRLNKHRAPANAVIFQSILAGFACVVIFFLAPAIGGLGGNSSALATQVYNVVLAALTLIFSLSTVFYFVDLVAAARLDRVTFRQKRVCPMWLLWVSVVIGPATCLVVVVDTLQNSWIPQLISNSQWWYIVGGIALISIIVAGLLTMYGSSQVAWEELRSE